jgi:type I restriction enzyme S subunit
MGAEQLITENIGLWASAIKAKATQGRGSNKKRELYGIKKLRELILELAVRGKLVPQDPNDEPASVLLERIAAEKQQLVKQMMIKKPKNLAEIVAGELPFTLPTGWQWARLQDMTSYIQRGMGPQYNEFGTVRVVSQKCVQWSGFDLEASRHVANESLGKYQEERFLQTGDLLWNSTGTGTVGRIIELGEIPAKTLVADSHVTVVRPLEVLGGFLKAYIAAPGIQSRFEPDHKSALVSGSTNQVELNTSAVETLEVPVPPKAEQHRIVAKVDELMALCDQVEQQTEISLDSHQRLVDALLESLVTAKAPSELSENWARLSDNFDTLITTDYAVEQLKKTILQFAVMGKLVPQDPTDEPTGEMLERITAERKNKIRRGVPISVDMGNDIEICNIPESWEVYSTAELLVKNAILDLKDGNHGANHPVKSDWTEDGLPFITAAQVNDYKIDYEGANKLSGEALTRLRVGFSEPNDVIYTHKGSVGRTAINTKPCILSPQTTYYRLNEKVLFNKYLMYFFQSKFFTDQVDKVKKQTTRDFVAITKQYLFFILIPPIEEQRRIATKIDQLMAVCDQLKTRINRAQTTLLHLADTVVYELIGEPVKNIEGSEINTKTMKITTVLSLNYEGFEDEAIIAPVILELGGSADAKDVWSKTKLSLPEFYAQLKIEIEAKYIIKPTSADFEEV